MDSTRLLDVPSFAVVGASPHRHYATSLVANMRGAGYPDERILLVNPRYRDVAGLPCLPSLADCPVPPAVVAVTLGTDRVEGTLKEAADAGARAVLVLASGYAEAGSAGRERQRRLTELALQLDLVVLGPSSLGYVAPPEHVGAWAAGAIPGRLRAGSAALVFQSSGMLNLMLGLATHRQLGVRAAVALGTEAALDAGDLVRDLAHDPATDVIGLVIEGTTRPHVLVDGLATAADCDKPVVVLKLGRSQRAQENTLAHSGRLAGAERVWRTVLDRYGALRVDDLDQLFETLTLLSRHRDTRRARLGVATISGGDCGLISDLAEDNGVPLPRPSASVHERLAELLRTDHLVGNPLDCENLAKREPERFDELIRTFCADDAVDLVAYRMNLPTKPNDEVLGMYRRLLAHARDAGKRPVLLSRAAEQLDTSWFEFAAAERTPFLISYGNAFVALGRLSRWAERSRETAPYPAAVPSAPGEPGPGVMLSWRATRRLLADVGLPYVRGELATEPGEAAALAERIGYPVVAKAWAPGLSHKSDAGAVRIGLGSPAEVREACTEMRRALIEAGHGDGIEGFEIQAMVSGGHEVVVGLHRDPTFGPVVLVGSGGLYTELRDDVAVALPPLTVEQVRALIARLDVAPALHGARGRRRHDVDALCDVIVRLARYGAEHGDDVLDLELNPVMVLPEGDGVVAVDALAVVPRHPDRSDHSDEEAIR